MSTPGDMPTGMDHEHDPDDDAGTAAHDVTDPDEAGPQVFGDVGVKAEPGTGAGTGGGGDEQPTDEGITNPGEAPFS